MQWTTYDSLYAYNQARNGKHINGDFDFLASSNILGGSADALNFWVTAGGSGSFTAFNSGGINGITLSTAASSTGQASIGYGYNNGFRPFSFISSTDPAFISFRFRPNDLNDGTDRFYLQIGLVDAGVTNIANGYYMTYDLSGTQTGSAASAYCFC